MLNYHDRKAKLLILIVKISILITIDIRKVAIFGEIWIKLDDQ